MSDPPPPPVVSPDSKFYWDGQRWVPMSGPQDKRRVDSVLEDLDRELERRARTAPFRVWCQDQAALLILLGLVAVIVLVPIIKQAIFGS
jgi:hypothetical protein